MPAQVYDTGVQRHYYWNTETDDVCWLSPTHRRAVIGEAAPRLAAGEHLQFTQFPIMNE